MALIKCPECGKTISDKAEYCVGCGYSIAGTKRINEQLNGINKKWLLIATAAILVAIVLFSINNEKKTKSMHSEYYDYEPSYSLQPKSGNEGALEKAKSYLNSSAFSYDGLIEQLEYEGYLTSEAKYAADNCGANWKEQALMKARSYLASSSFSESGLQEQLEFEGFSSTEASYGVSNCGADWKEQAAKKAASYLDSHDFSKSELIDQLEFEGFTYEQASYGANRNLGY